MVTCAITRDENSLQFILQLTELDLWKFELPILEEDMKMTKSFSPFPERIFALKVDKQNQC